jgi:hypothetical protein
MALRGLKGVPQTQMADSNHSSSWMSPDAKSQPQLLYVSDQSGQAVDVYSYPKGKLVGTLSGFDAPAGICSDKVGNVYITNGNNFIIDVYAHGGKTPARTITLPGYPQLNCTVDPQSGSLALGVITDTANEVAVFAKAKGTPAVYSPSGQNGFPGCAYDAHGNLFCDAYGSSGTYGLYELPRKSTALGVVSVSGTSGLIGGPMDWDGKNLTFASGSRGTIYRIDQSASGDSIGSSTGLTGTGSVWQYLIDGKLILAPTEGGSLPAEVAIYKYPFAKSVVQAIKGAAYPDGVAISTLKK